MNKILIALLLILVIVATTLAASTTWLIVLAVRGADNTYNENIGRKVVLNKDTLIIVDYSSLQSNFTLSNGAKVSKDYINVIKEQ